MFSIASIIANALKLFNTVMGMFQSKQDRDAGAAAQVLVDKTAEVKADQNALKAAIDTTDQSVRNSLRNGNF